MALAVINPATGETEEKFAALSPAELEVRLARAGAAAASYRRTSFDVWAGWMQAAADLLDRDRDEVATMMTTEMGKTLAAARAEVDEVRPGLPLLRRARRDVPRRRAGRRGDGRCPPRLRDLRAARRRARRHAVELPAVAGRCASPRRRSWPATSAC